MALDWHQIDADATGLAAWELLFATTNAIDPVRRAVWGLTAVPNARMVRVLRGALQTLVGLANLACSNIPTRAAHRHQTRLAKNMTREPLRI